MMFRTFATLSALGVASAAVELPTNDIDASSKLGGRILAASRQLDNENFTWIAGYSIQFVKCATSDEYYGGNWGGDNNQNRNNYNGMQKQRLVHYKLCPTGSSSCTNSADYVIDMNMFVEAFIESKLDAQEYNCEMARESCYNDDETQCYYNAGLDYCVENENNNDQAAQFQLEDAVECKELDVEDEALQYYYYEQGANAQQQYYQGNQDQEMKLFIGPYCSANGKSIHLGTFMDETCSWPAPSGTYEKFSYGVSLPYSTENLIDSEFVSCKEPQDADDNNNGDQQDEDEVLEICERLYEDSAKCEEGLADGVTYYPNTYGCEFLKSLKAPGKMNSSTSSVSAAKVFAGLFAATTVVCAGVAFYMYQQNKRSNVKLNENDGTLA